LGEVTGHVASDTQLQQLPGTLLQQTAMQLLHAPAASQLVISAAAAALLLRVLAAALQSQVDGDYTQSSAKVHAAVLLHAVCGRLPDSAAAAAADLLPLGQQAFKLPFRDVHDWLQQLGQSATGRAAAAVATLLQGLLQQSMLFALPRKQSWQLYQLLLELQQQPAWQQQGLTGLTTGACDALIQQQREPAWYGTAAGSVLQLL
jgi:hypothetical protein